jgi:serine/threonine-protein kinase SRPK3
MSRFRQYLSRIQTPVFSRRYRPESEATPSPFSWLIPRDTHTTPKSSSFTCEERPKKKYCPGGYYPVHLGEIFEDRYKVISKLGYDVYSTVWLAKDLTEVFAIFRVAYGDDKSSFQSPLYVALKILTADSFGGSKPVYELDIRKHISQTDHIHPGYKHVVHLLNSFVHEGPNGKHSCLVLELMGAERFPFATTLSK